MECLLLLFYINLNSMRKAAKMNGTGKSFLQFLDSRRADLQRISRATCGEYSEKDLHGVAWEIAAKISTRRKATIKFSEPAEQELILSWLYNEVVNFEEKNVRCAVRLDKDWDSDEARSSEDRLAFLLDRCKSFDQTGLMDSEERQGALLEIIKHSYSQYSAYLILLDRFGWDIIVMAEHLRLLAATIVRRIQTCQQHIRFQSSLFDRLLVIENNFVATVARTYRHIPANKEYKLATARFGSVQLVLFGEELIVEAPH